MASLGSPAKSEETASLSIYPPAGPVNQQIRRTMIVSFHGVAPHSSILRIVNRPQSPFFKGEISDNACRKADNDRFNEKPRSFLVESDDFDLCPRNRLDGRLLGHRSSAEDHSFALIVLSFSGDHPFPC
ncbi:MAG: hypothetical protein PHF93_11375 [Acidobacteriota bacterium]|nr:hypothetical protein [Acidobacteriota bacterium]HNT32665.1 hypothetical protein [Candidatus Aminicenantes bacterium]MDD8010300.1 hypothetical protein [Acidobacteriota bacterium]MDD8034406.1 hypothetical protein [Acidobacteriota bacterium]MDW3227948.1 hypothetical protein [Acidobacteriota bacterium]